MDASSAAATDTDGDADGFAYIVLGDFGGAFLLPLWIRSRHMTTSESVSASTFCGALIKVEARVPTDFLTSRYSSSWKVASDVV